MLPLQPERINQATQRHSMRRTEREFQIVMHDLVSMTSLKDGRIVTDDAFDSSGKVRDIYLGRLI